MPFFPFSNFPTILLNLQNWIHQKTDAFSHVILHNKMRHDDIKKKINLMTIVKKTSIPSHHRIIKYINIIIMIIIMIFSMWRVVTRPLKYIFYFLWNKKWWEYSDCVERVIPRGMKPRGALSYSFLKKKKENEQVVVVHVTLLVGSKRRSTGFFFSE